VIALSDQLAEALRNAERYSQINNEGIRLRVGLEDGTHRVLVGDAGAHLPTGDERSFGAFSGEDKTFPKWDVPGTESIFSAST